MRRVSEGSGSMMCVRKQRLFEATENYALDLEVLYEIFISRDEGVRTDRANLEESISRQ